MSAAVSGSLLAGGELVLGGRWFVAPYEDGWRATAQLAHLTVVAEPPEAGRYQFRIAGESRLHEVRLSIVEGTELILVAASPLPSVIAAQQRQRGCADVPDDQDIGTNPERQN